MKKNLALFFHGMLLLANFAPSLLAQQASTVPPPEYKVGQIWKYNSPPGAEGSVVLILKISTDGARGRVIHIRVDSVPIHCGNVNVNATSSVGHLAITEQAFRQSTTQLLVDDVGKIPELYLDPSRDWGRARPSIIDRPLSKVKIASPQASLICSEVQQRHSAK